MTSLNYVLARKLLKVKSKKQNGFTLIELMVVVAIVGVLTAVGLPELSKAQDRAKDSAAEATLVNAAKECSINLLTLPAATAKTDFTAATADGAKFVGVNGDCEIPSDGSDLALSIESESGNNGYTITFDGTVPRTPVEAPLGS